MFIRQQVISDVKAWQKQMLSADHRSLISFPKKRRTKVNSWIPEKVHNAVTIVIKQMIRGVLFGAKYTTADPLRNLELAGKGNDCRRKIKFYRTTAAVEGGITGVGGILLGLADFPILIALKIKLLFEVASLYGFDVADYKERVYLLHIFELAFSSHAHRKTIYLKMENWDQKSKEVSGRYPSV